MYNIVVICKDDSSHHFLNVDHIYSDTYFFHIYYFSDHKLCTYSFSLDFIFNISFEFLEDKE